MKALASAVNVESRVLLIRGHRVILDADLALVYGVTTTRLNEQVHRNAGRFPSDFVFRLTSREFKNLISRNATSSWGGRRKLPFAFTEHGAIMAASVLSSARAVEMSVYVVRAFVKLRELASHHKDLLARLSALESKYDDQFRVVFDSIRELMEPPTASRKKIGFKAER